jgi:hypothetical protein
LRQLLDIAWKVPLFAVPFALFFGTLYGNGRRDSYVGAYIVSLVIGVVIMLFVWVTEHFIAPRLRRGRSDTGRSSVAEALMYVVASIAGAYTAALIIRLTIAPGFFGDTRGFLVFGMFTILFAVLFSAIAYSLYWYRKSLDRARAEQELNLARRIQRSFLLSQFPEMPRIDLHAVNVSSKEVSGDFYDVVPAGNDSFLLAVADVSGKGVPAALLTSMLQASLRTQAGTEPSVSRILANVNRLVYRNSRRSSSPVSTNPARDSASRTPATTSRSCIGARGSASRWSAAAP